MSSRPLETLSRSLVVSVGCGLRIERGRQEERWPCRAGTDRGLLDDRSARRWPRRLELRDEVCERSLLRRSID
jgi:hypothetical protein